MGITALGHRKIILKGAEDLRVNRRIVNPPHPPSLSTIGAGKQAMDKFRDESEEQKMNKNETAMDSHGSPVSNNSFPIPLLR